MHVCMYVYIYVARKIRNGQQKNTRSPNSVHTLIRARIQAYTHAYMHGRESQEKPWRVHQLASTCPRRYVRSSVSNRISLLKKRKACLKCCNVHTHMGTYMHCVHLFFVYKHTHIHTAEEKRTEISFTFTHITYIYFVHIHTRTHTITTEEMAGTCDLCPGIYSTCRFLRIRGRSSKCAWFLYNQALWQPVSFQTTQTQFFQHFCSSYQGIRAAAIDSMLILLCICSHI
jgi:hypothetical protein